MLALSAIITASVLASVRERMKPDDLNYAAYIVPSNGEHYSDVTAPCERRIASVSNFTGSAGTVIITAKYALLWTDGRYFEQAERQLDKKDWILMRDGEPNTPSQADWLKGNLTSGDRVAVDGSLYPKSTWEAMKTELAEAGITLVDDQENLIDFADPSKPPCPANDLVTLPNPGQTVAEKLDQVRKKMAEEKAVLLLVSELDEIAWLFNLRGTDLPPVFYAYAIIGVSTAQLIVKDVELPPGVVDELDRIGVDVEENGYNSADATFKDAVDATPAGSRVWVSKFANEMMAKQTAGRLELLKLSPVALLKAIKNPTEVAGMKAAHLRDSAAIIAFLSWLETKIVKDSATDVTEMSAAEKLLEIRQLAKDEGFQYPSFSTLSAFGPNAAIIHYSPTPETDATITKLNLYLVDSGGQYLDGTTDITRTVHFGVPSDEQKELFTRVLKGHIAVASSIFPKKTTGHRLDSLARKSLWDVKLDYGHGTGHGIGHNLFVHEGPQKMTYTGIGDDTGFEAGMFLSNEPGYYKPGKFGMRIENIVHVAEVKNQPGFLEFETISFVPIQLGLIDKDLLTLEEIAWLDNYHLKCREMITEYVNSVTYFEDKEAILKWLDKSTVTWGQFSSGSKVFVSTFTLVSVLFVQRFFNNFIM